MIQYLIPNDSTHLKTLLAGNRIHNHVAMNANEVLAIQDRVLVLPSRVDDLEGEVLVPVADDFAEGVFDGRVVGVDKVAIDELDCERGLAYAWVRLVEVRRCTLVACCVPTDLLPTMAILRIFCCGAMVAGQCACCDGVSSSPGEQVMRSVGVLGFSNNVLD
jgi:hypothetical protein